jgi:rare lipoprotein A
MKVAIYYFFVIIVILVVSSCGKTSKVYIPPSKHSIAATQRPYTINRKTYYPLPSADGFVQEGKASWYGKKFHGKSTSNGEKYNMYAMTAAHKILPMGTYVSVKNLDNGRQCVVRVNDRGPFVKGRVIDLSYNAAKKLGVVGKGIAHVRVEALGEVTGSGASRKFAPHPDFRHGVFYIQVGSFLSPRNAYAYRKKLERRYKNVVVSPYMKDYHTFYRVQIFASTDYEEAKAFESALERACNPEAFVVAK